MSSLKAPRSPALHRATIRRSSASEAVRSFIEEAVEIFGPAIGISVPVRLRHRAPLLFGECMRAGSVADLLGVDADVVAAVNAAQGDAIMLAIQHNDSEALLAAHVLECVETNQADALQTS